MQRHTILEPLPLFRLSVVLMVGIVVADWLAGVVPAVGWLCATAGATAGALASGRLSADRRAWVQSGLVMAAVLLLGATLTALARQQLSVRLPAEAVDYEAVVTTEPQVKGKTIRMDMLLTTVAGRRLSRPVSVRTSLLRDTVAARWRMLHVGSGLRARSVLKPLQATATRRHFDYVRWAQVHGYQGQTFVPGGSWEPAAADLAVLSLWQRARLRTVALRQQMLQRFKALGLSDQQYAVVAAMALGDRSGLSASTRDSYAVSGASHVLALSGLHLGIIYGLLALLLGRRKRWLWVGQGVTLCAVWTYVLLVGFPLSAVRSATMLTVCTIVMLLQRQRISVNTLAFAAVVMLLVNPLSLWDVGFQLSFMAVLGIMIYRRAIYRLWQPRARVLRWAWGMAAVSLAAQLTTAPLVVYYFGRFSCYFLLTNFVVVPAATVILYATLLLMLTSAWPAAGRVVAWLLALVAGWLNDAVASMASWPGASVEDIRLSWVQVVALYVALAALTVLVTRAAGLRRLHVLDVFNDRQAPLGSLMPADDLPEADGVPADDESP